MSTTWKQKAAEAQAALDAKIPSAWRIDPAVLSSLPSNVNPIFASAGILSKQELEITTVKDATVLLEKIHSGAWSAEQVTLAFCKRAAMAHQMIKCLMDVDFDGALKRARELDEYFKKTGKVVGPLHGLPVSLKDLTSVKGMKLTLGLVKWADNVQDFDAVTVQGLRNAGVVVYVKTTMPQTGMALETVSNLWGRTLNPFNKHISAGGSSGGEGALNGCLGAPAGIATDIGGSIRAPAAFNGLYGIRPTSRRISYAGQINPVTGQIAIPSSIGPVGRSVRDLSLICKSLVADEPWFKDPTVMDKPWASVEVPKKATIGIMWWDDVVMPHPPIQRALKEAAEKLRAAGHEVIDFKPYKQKHAWEITRTIYFPTAGKEMLQILDDVSEPLIPSASKLIKPSKALTVPELMKYHTQQRAFQTEFMAHWNSTAALTSNGKPINAILSPAAACASFPHDFLPWWGYFSLWNLLDYPTVIIPTGFVDASVDAKDTGYTPVSEPDKENYDIYDPQVFDGAPVALQLIGRTLGEEKLLAVAEAVDQAVNSK